MASYTIKQYSGDAPPTTLALSIGSADSTIIGTNLASYPDGSIGPFVIDINLGGATEEKILCSSRSGNTLTVAASGRGYDSTVAAPHVGANSGVAESLNHVITAVDMTEANAAVIQTIGKVTSLGDILVGSGANTLARVGVGSTGQVLTVSGGTAAWGATALPGPPKTYTPVWSSSGTQPALGNGSIAGSYLDLGGLTWINILLTTGSTTTYGTGTWYWSLPSVVVTLGNTGPFGVGTAVGSSAGGIYGSCVPVIVSSTNVVGINTFTVNSTWINGAAFTPNLAQGTPVTISGASQSFSLNGWLSHS